MPARRRVLVTGARGMLGRAVCALLGDDVVPFDRVDGHELTDRTALDAALADVDVVVHLAALHPLIAPPDADDATYRAANVTPFVSLLDAARRRDVQRIVLASSTSVWRDSTPGEPARFLEERSPADGGDAYARSKLECEELLAHGEIAGVTLRLARFARAGSAEDEVRKLYRAVDPRDIASAIARAIDLAPDGALYAISAPTPFTLDDATLLDRDPRAAIRTRTRREPVWAPRRIGSVIVAARAMRELAWSCLYPSALMGSAPRI